MAAPVALTTYCLTACCFLLCVHCTTRGRPSHTRFGAGWDAVRGSMLRLLHARLVAALLVCMSRCNFNMAHPSRIMEYLASARDMCALACGVARFAKPAITSQLCYTPSGMCLAHFAAAGSPPCSLLHTSLLPRQRHRGLQRPRPGATTCKQTCCSSRTLCGSM